MNDLNLLLQNGSMDLRIIAVIGDRALLQRLNDSSFVVVNGLHIHNDFNCDWNFAYGYFETYDRAFTCFNDKVIKEFQEYAEVVSCEERE